MPTKKLIFVIILTVPLALVAYFLSASSSPKTSSITRNNESNIDYISQNSTIPPCGDEKEFFTTSPVNVSDFMGLVPLGNLAPADHTFPTDHVYFHINRIDKSQWDLGTIETNVYAPGDIWITEIALTDNEEGSKFSDDYQIHFAACNEVRAFFIHVSSISDALENEIGEYDDCYEQSTSEFEYKYCRKIFQDPVRINAGEIIGTAGGGPNKNALDLGVYDLRNPAHEFANPERWSDRSKHIACPLDYFSPKTKNSLLTKLGNHDLTIPRVIDPICGEIEQDEPGTAQGVWFNPTTENSFREDTHLALVYDNINPRRAVFSVGTSLSSVGIPVQLYYFEPTEEGTTNRLFSDVTNDGKVYCYDGLKDQFERLHKIGSILISMPNETTLMIDSQNGQCGPVKTMTSDAVMFER